MAGSLGSIYARIGADTSDFQAKLASSSNALSVWERGVSSRGASAERALVKVAAGTSQLMHSFGVMSTQGTLAMQTILDKLGLIELAIPAALLMMAPQIGAFVNKVTGLGAAFADAGKPAGELAGFLAEDAAAFDGAATQLAMLIEHFKLAGPEWQFSTERTKENAQQIIFLTDRVAAEARARKEASGELLAYTIRQKLANERTAEAKALHAGSVKMLEDAREAQIRFNESLSSGVPPSVQIAIALARGQQEMKAFGDETRKAYGILNADDVQAGAANIVKQIQAIATTGGTADQVVAKMGPTILDLADKASKMGVDVGLTFTNLADDIKSGATWSVEGLMEQMKRLPDAAKAGTEASRRELGKIGDELEGSVSGGFGRGIDGGISYGEQQLRAFVQRNPVTLPVKLQLDTTGLPPSVLRALGISPTGGGV